MGLNSFLLKELHLVDVRIQWLQVLSQSISFQTLPNRFWFFNSVTIKTLKVESAVKNESMLYVNFPKHVKEITIRSDYKSLELFAEIGGYVWLFMDVSIVYSTMYLYIVQIKSNFEILHYQNSKSGLYCSNYLICFYRCSLVCSVFSKLHRCLRSISPIV